MPELAVLPVTVTLTLLNKGIQIPDVRLKPQDRYATHIAHVNVTLLKRVNDIYIQVCWSRYYILKAGDVFGTVFSAICTSLVLCRCWLGSRKGIRPVKTEWWVLAWLSVWSEVQMICMWSGWCHCHYIISCSSKIQNGLPFWCRLTQVVLEKGR